MKKSFQLKAAVLFAFALLVSVVTFAQDKPASPRDSVSGKAAGSTITINYGSPSVKGRKIWGGLEAYGKVWRAGANEATTFTTTKDIKVEGKPLAAGTYGFFLIPNENGTWTVIFNKVAKQWGAFKYDESKDALRVDVKTKAAPMHEKLVYTVDAKSFCMFWDKIVVPVAVSK